MALENFEGAGLLHHLFDRLRFLIVTSSDEHLLNSRPMVQAMVELDGISTVEIKEEVVGHNADVDNSI
jgi:hypothetical protein